ncbi:unnamed protein product [Brugia timori]|uniref:Uncharacterized protein n=1 Tax=Brugia timori TaxID=42155 RepID=A0A0R3QG84_9BILA|nr:unnamed protein product [Brugia timori]
MDTVNSSESPQKIESKDYAENCSSVSLFYLLVFGLDGI